MIYGLMRGRYTFHGMEFGAMARGADPLEAGGLIGKIVACGIAALTLLWNAKQKARFAQTEMVMRQALVRERDQGLLRLLA